eukprot:m.132227 g.132227  ORF g.132227 m.132227 type:complete len:393 (-) comp16844_c0_seq2:361-1539(-)
MSSDEGGDARETQFLKQFARAKRHRSSTYSMRLPTTVTEQTFAGEAHWMASEYLGRGTNDKGLAWKDMPMPTVMRCIGQTSARVVGLDPAMFRREDGHYNSKKMLVKIVSVADSYVRKWLASVKQTESVVPRDEHFRTDVCSTQGCRSSMEDKHVAVSDVNACMGLPATPERQGFFAVMDGHNGVSAARFVQAQLLPLLVGHPRFASDPVLALRDTYVNCDKQFETLRENGGTTCVSVLIRNNKMFVAWVGDSLAVLSRGGKCVYLMDPHKPDRADERERIEKAGGMVSCVYGVWRVNQVIAVSRSIGDVRLKEYISAEADVAEVSLTEDDEFVIIACDGLWDVMSPSQAVAFVHRHDAQSGSDKTVAQDLVQHALDEGSKDNITCMVVRLK